MSDPLTPEEETDLRAILDASEKVPNRTYLLKCLATLDAARAIAASRSHLSDEPPPALRDALATALDSLYAYKATRTWGGDADAILADPGVRAALGAATEVPQPAPSDTEDGAGYRSGDGLRGALDRADVLALIDQEEP